MDLTTGHENIWVYGSYAPKKSKIDLEQRSQEFFKVSTEINYFFEKIFEILNFFLFIRKAIERPSFNL